MPEQQQNLPLDVPINVGTAPDWQIRFGHPTLLNMFVGASEKVYSTPGLNLILMLRNARFIYYTIFNGGSFIVVNDTQILRMSMVGTYSVLANIIFSGLPIQIDENLQNQISIVDGLKLYVIDQRANTFTVMGEAQGFGFKTPCSVVDLNSFTIVLDTITNSFLISSPNNSLNFPGLNNVPTIQSQLTQAVSLATINSNLYIFGTTGIERWEPNYNVNAFLFPFSRDNNFRRDFGAIGTGAVRRGINNVYFLSNKFTYMVLTEQGTQELAEPGSDIGIAKIISQYPDVSNCYCSFYSFRGSYFAHYTFPETGISWVYCENSKKIALSDDLILSTPDNIEYVLTTTGVYQLGFTTPVPKHRQIILPRLFDYQGQQNYRAGLMGVEVRMNQGNLQALPQQNLELTISLDSIKWLNSVSRPIGLTGERNALTIWRTNLSGYEFTLRIDYYGLLDFCIEKITAEII